MNVRLKQNRTICVSFSGIDGSGKSTQIHALRNTVEQAGLRVSMIRFWDDIACLTRLRETSGHQFFKGDKGIGSPDRPINRRDKNVRSWPMSCVRIFVYSIDALSTCAAMAKARHSGVDLFIFDRYLYDELANLNLANPLMRLYARLLISLTPRPDISFILDAEPAAARARKPEYPLDFLCLNRQAYLELNYIAGGMTIIPPLPITTVMQEVLRHALRKLPIGIEPSQPDAVSAYQR